MLPGKTLLLNKFCLNARRPWGHRSFVWEEFRRPIYIYVVECAAHFGPKAIALANDTLTNPFSFHYVESYNFRTVGPDWRFQAVTVGFMRSNMGGFGTATLIPCVVQFYGIVFLMDWGRKFVLSFFLWPPGAYGCSGLHRRVALQRSFSPINRFGRSIGQSSGSRILTEGRWSWEAWWMENEDPMGDGRDGGWSPRPLQNGTLLAIARSTN